MTSWTRREYLIVPFAATAALAVAAVLYNLDYPLYKWLLTQAFPNQFRTPFIDTEFVQTITECWARGVNVYRENPCDQLARPQDYSPLWLRLAFIPTDRTWTPWLGLGIAGLFIASLAFLPAPRQRLDLAIMALAVFSSLSVFAVERGNVDLLMFVLAVGACRCAMSSHLVVRLAGYALILLAGLLKFYPLALLFVLLRETFLRALAIGAVCAAVLAGFVWLYADELADMARNIPTGPFFTDLFGARQLPGGLWMAIDQSERLLGLPGIDAPATKLLIALGCTALLAAATALHAIRLARRPDFRVGLAALPRDRAVFLMAGTALVVGCFVAAQNIGYRGVILLLVLPGLTRLAETRASAWAIVFVMWGLTIVHLLRTALGGFYPGSLFPAAFFAHWLVHELAWWWIVSDCLAVLLASVMAWQAMRDLSGLFPKIAPAR